MAEPSSSADSGRITDEFFWDSVFSELLDELSRRRLTKVGGLDGAAVSFAAAAVHRLAGPVVLVAPGASAAAAFRDDLAGMLKNVLFFPPYETLPFEGEPAHPGVIADRVECMAALGSGSRKSLVVLPASALLKKVPLPGSFHTMKLTRGMSLPMEKLEAWLTAAGYLRESGVWEQGRWARRGGIVDIGSFGMDNPVRLEFLGNTLESIRFFDQRSQRSIRDIGSVRVLPAREAVLSPDHWNRAMDTVPDDHELSEKLWTSNGFPGIEHYLPVFLNETGSILDFIPRDGTVVFHDPDGIRGAMEDSLEFLRGSFPGEKLPFSFGDVYFSREEVMEGLDRAERTVSLEPFPRGDVDVNYTTLPQTGFHGHRSEMLRQFRSWQSDGYRITVLSDSPAEEETFLELIPEELELETAVMSISEGFLMPERRLAVLSERRLLSGRRRPERVRTYRGGEGLEDTSDISPGDLVVHRRYGIGLFTGIEQVETSGVLLDCLAVEYRDGDRLLVPINEIGSVQKFMAPERAAPRLDKLGGTGWSRRVSGARRKARDIAGRLAAIYAARRAMEREPFPPPGRHVEALARSFPYEETPDQMKAINRVMDDFQRDCPMDRLVCGDVGYGKTEIAIRAAFRAADAGKQVAILVPTTVLAEQHYYTFRDRLAEFPVKIGMLSRFRSPAQQRKVLSDLAVGEQDIVIGTHRLLQKDVRFNDLGLLVIDEEHRFGVRQKEYLRELRTGVDTLAMTATPIPRTLHMALSGFRNISIIATPPRDRYPVHTELIDFNARIIARAVKRELARDGQVFFVHNRIKSIMEVKDKLQSMLPQVRITVGHGQMSPKRLEEVMHSFMEGEYQILLSTSIIESGLDLPRVNTMIIDNAHMFGLADLYQLRGRVGRSHHQAYCYLVVPAGKKLKPEARNRLDAIRKFTELGSGWNVAMRDLEIRGAGELLGSSQHGQMISIGYSLFEDLIREEAQRLRGEGSPVSRQVRVEIPGDFYLPSAYVPDVTERIRIYRSVWKARSESDIDRWLDYLRDRFGDTGEPVENCALRARIGFLASEAGVEEVVVTSASARLVFAPGAEVDGRIDFPGRPSVKLEKTGRVIVTLGLRGIEEDARMDETLKLLRRLPRV